MLRSASLACARGEPAEVTDKLATALTLAHDLYYP
jgi:hypothetical protein